MRTKRLRFILIPLILIIVLAGAMSAAATITIDESIGKLSRHSLEWLMGMRSEEICSGMEEKLCSEA